MDIESFDSYRGLPPVAGITSLDEAAKIGHSIDTCVSRLKRHHWALRRLHEIFIARIADEPMYELKMGFSLHAHYCAEHAAAWRKRVAEMREPPLGLDKSPDPALDVFFDEIRAASDTESLLLAIYEVAIPTLRRAMERHIETTNRLVDHPSFRICRFALMELVEMEEFGAACISKIVSENDREQSQFWITNLNTLLRIAGDLDGSSEALEAQIRRITSDQPYQYKRVPRRDARFVDSYNMGVHAEAFLYDDQYAPEPKTLMMYYKRLREIDVPEMMASIIFETKGKPWNYYVDMTRQLWDEARHAMMGEIGFLRLGIDWARFARINKTWSLALNTQLSPIERHAVLYFIEQGLMPKSGKRFEWEVAIASGDPFSSMIQDYDWADEVLHARIGRDWYVKEMSSSKAAAAYGDECWSKVLIDWTSYKELGLTEHENWWPELYREYCRVSAREPDPKALDFNTSYETARADLKDISASA